MIVKYLVAASLVLTTSFTLLSCSNNKEEKTEESSAPAEDLSQNPDYQKGVSLVGKNDCVTCHDVKVHTTGPSFIEIAKKYDNTPANVDMLVAKIQKGGSGHWGNVPMTPHPNLSSEDAKALVTYILLLKNQ